VLFPGAPVTGKGLLPPPTQKGKTPVFPQRDFVTASVAVYVQAQAQ
jgi:hypothetical protein